MSRIAWHVAMLAVCVVGGVIDTYVVHFTPTGYLLSGTVVGVCFAKTFL